MQFKSPKSDNIELFTLLMYCQTINPFGQTRIEAHGASGHTLPFKLQHSRAIREQCDRYYYMQCQNQRHNGEVNRRCTHGPHMPGGHVRGFCLRQKVLKFSVLGRGPGFPCEAGRHGDYRISKAKCRIL